MGILIDSVSLVLVHTTSIGVAIIVTGMLVVGSGYKDGSRVTLRTFIIDLLSSKLDRPGNLWSVVHKKKMDENTIGFLWKASRLVATSSVLQCHYL
jgi:hypothetical protein